MDGVELRAAWDPVVGFCLKKQTKQNSNRNLPASNPEGGSILPDMNINSLISKKEG